MRLKDRVAIVTGAASGIGRASAELFAAEGAQVLAVDLPGSALVAAFQDAAGIVPLPLSIVEPDAPARIVGEAVARFGRLDILFNNAGVSGRHFVEEMEDSDWERIMAVNVTAQMKLARAAIHNTAVNATA